MRESAKLPGTQVKLNQAFNDLEIFEFHLVSSNGGLTFQSGFVEIQELFEHSDVEPADHSEKPTLNEVRERPCSRVRFPPCLGSCRAVGHF